MDIPYEKQADAPAHRMCGAAALCMVYRSLGTTCTQAEVWPSIARRKAGGSFHTKTFLLAQDALRRGFAALVLEARDPCGILQRCHEHQVRAILNHRISSFSAAGHYSVLVSVSGEHVVVHDPQHGPDRRYARAEFLELWQPSRAGSEITGHVLVAVCHIPPSQEKIMLPCSVCGRPLPAVVPCSHCRTPVVMQPAIVLGCGNAACPERTWKGIFCPVCDVPFSSVADSA